MSYVVLGAALLAYGVIVLRRDGSRATRFYGLSFIAGWISLTLWPQQNSMALDTVTHVPGLGRLINDTFATLSVMLQFAFISTLTDMWSCWRKGAIIAYAVLLALLLLAWIPVHLTVTRNFPELFYHGYYARPWALLAWNLLLDIAITYTCALSLIGYLHALSKTRTHFTRATTSAAVVVYAVAAVYGLLVIAQLVADRLGFGHTGVLQFTKPIVLACVLVTLCSTGAVLFGQAAWRYAREWLSLSRKQAAIERLLKDTINANVLVSDQRVYLRGDTDIVRAVDSSCRQRFMSPYRRKVAREAVRFIILSHPSIISPTRDHVDPPLDTTDQSPADADIDDRRVLADLPRRVMEDVYFYADVYRVARLAILMMRGGAMRDGGLPELEQRDEPRGWRRDVAAVLVDVLKAHRHSEERSLQAPGAPDLVGPRI